MRSRLRIFSLQQAAAVLVAIGLTASPTAADQGSGQVFGPLTPADIQSEPSFLATPAFARLVETKSIVVITMKGQQYEGHFTISGNALVLHERHTVVTIPFQQVERVEKSTFRIRTHSLIGLGIGTLVGSLLLADLCEGGCGVGTGLLFVGALGGATGTGIGARNGAKLNATYGETDIVYDLGGRWVSRRSSFAYRVKGKEVWITTLDGARRRGKIAVVTADGLTLTGPEHASLPFDQIATIVEVSHRVRNGMLSGLAAGGSIGLLMCTGPAPSCGDGLKATAIGVGTGIMVAAAMNLDKNRDLLFDSGRRARTMSFAPILSPKRKGMAFRMTWR